MYRHISIRYQYTPTEVQALYNKLRKVILIMRNKEDLKTERKTVLMTKSLAEDIENEAKKRGIKANTVMIERLAHHQNSLDPPLMAKIQDLANHASRAIQENAPKEAEKIQKEANAIWTYLNKNE